MLRQRFMSLGMGRSMLTALVAAGLSWGCGQNALESTESDDPAEDAAILLEEDKPKEADKLLADALKKDEYKNDPQLLSIQSLAKAQRAGLDPLTFATNMAEQGNDLNATQNEFTGLFDIMPDATNENLSFVGEAVTILSGIPKEDRLDGDQFKLAMFQTARAALIAKKIDSNFDGSLDASEVEDLTAEDAVTLLNEIDSAKNLLAEEDSDAAQEASEQIDKYVEKIDSEDGSTREEKLKNYLASQDSSG